MADCAVFASGTGSNYQAIFRHVEELRLSGQASHRLVCLVSDKPNCGAVAHARSVGLPVVLANYRADKPRAETEAEIIDALAPFAPDLLVLAGFMRLLTPLLVDAWPVGRIVNIHPALLPRHPGTHGIEDSFTSGDRELGVTIHEVDHGMDTGRIILQRSFERAPDETLESAARRIHALEHQWYPPTVTALLDNIDQKKGNGGTA